MRRALASVLSLRSPLSPLSSTFFTLTWSHAAQSPVASRSSFCGGARGLFSVPRIRPRRVLQPRTANPSIPSLSALPHHAQATFTSSSSVLAVSPSSSMDPEAQIVVQDVLRMPEIQVLGSIFSKHGKEIRLVGGVVRDILLGVPPKDFDLATDARPEEVQAYLKDEGIKCLPTGLQHGTVTAVVNRIHFEITTLRIDEAHDGRWAEVRYTGDWSQDALRRDLTVNAMSIDMHGALHDYFGGCQHLRDRRILFVGDAATRMQEDYLRILRYFRFHGRLARSHDHDEATMKAVAANAEGLRRISGERVWQEMAKILVCGPAYELLQVMAEAKVLACIGLDHITPACLAEFHRVKECVANPTTLLAALLPDEPAFSALVLHWHLSNAERNLGVYILQNRGVPMTERQAQDELVNKVTPLHVCEVLRYQHKVALAESLMHWHVPQMPVSGKDLRARGIKPGPSMGLVLAALKQAWMESRFVLTAEDLLGAPLDAALAEAAAATPPQ